MKAYKLHEPRSLANFKLGDFDEPTARDYKVARLWCAWASLALK